MAQLLIDVGITLTAFVSIPIIIVLIWTARK